MGTYNFTVNGKTFAVKGPPGMTQEQAKAVFEQQLDTGSLVGFAPGDTLSAATQTALGLTSAAASLLQSAAGIPTNSLGISPTRSITPSPTAVNRVINVAPNTNSTAAVAATIGKKINSTTVLNPLTVGEYAKSTAATAATVGNLSTTQITATMASAEKISGQTAIDFTDNGVGKYALSCEQLERAGYVKAGTAAKFLSSGENSQSSVLASSAVWTGKDGVKNVEDLINNSQLQSIIQQNLMTTGTQQATQLGVDIKALTPAAAGAFALNAAKNVTDAVAWAKNQTLPSNISMSLNSAGNAGAYGVNLANQSLNDATKRIKAEVPAIDTINRATVNAASTRIVGNSKVPSTIPAEKNSAEKIADSAASYVDSFIATANSIADRLQTFYNNGNFTQDQIDSLQTEWTVLKQDFADAFDKLRNLTQQAIDKLSAPTVAQQIINDAQKKANNTILIENKINELLAKLLAILANRAS